MPITRECEKSNSDISALSAFGRSIDRMNNGLPKNDDKKEGKPDLFTMVPNQLSSFKGSEQ